MHTEQMEFVDIYTSRSVDGAKKNRQPLSSES